MLKKLQLLLTIWLPIAASENLKKKNFLDLVFGVKVPQVTKIIGEYIGATDTYRVLKIIDFPKYTKLFISSYPKVDGYRFDGIRDFLLAIDNQAPYTLYQFNPEELIKHNRGGLPTRCEITQWDAPNLVNAVTPIYCHRDYRMINRGNRIEIRGDNTDIPVRSSSGVHHPSIIATAMAATPTQIAMGTNEGSIDIYERESKISKFISICPEARGAQFVLTYSPCGKYLYSTHDKTTVITRWDYQNWKMWNFVPDVLYKTTHIACSPDNQLIATAHANGVIKVLNTSDHATLFAKIRPADIVQYEQVGAAIAISFTANNKLMAVYPCVNKHLNKIVWYDVYDAPTEIEYIEKEEKFAPPSPSPTTTPDGNAQYVPPVKKEQAQLSSEKKATSSTCVIL